MQSHFDSTCRLVYDDGAIVRRGERRWAVVMNINAVYTLVVGVFVGLLVYLVAGALRLRARSRPSTMAEATNRLLFALVILLFALVVKLVLSGLDVLVLLIAVGGLGVGWYGLSAAPHEPRPT